MAQLRHLVAITILVLVSDLRAQQQYQPTWESLDARPLPAWYDQSKFGIFIHWGVFSVPSFESEWFWYDWQGDSPVPEVVQFMQDNYPPDFTYPDFAPEFGAEFYDPVHWADVLQASGAKYVVLTSKHHEGFTMWPSSVSWNWNSMDVGPKRDLVGDLAKAIKNHTDLHFGLYHSLFEWFHPLYLQDKAGGFVNRTFPQYKALPELKEIVNAYEPEVVWSDGDWEAPDTYWTSTDFLAWLYNESPVKDTVVTNDRWGSGDMCVHGGYYTCSDRYNPGTLQPHKWENCMTIDKQSWGYRRNAVYSDIMTIEELISTLVTTISCGGNLLMNIGPTREGTIIPIFEERLRQMGQYLAVNGEAVYESVPWTYQNDTLTPNVWYTSKVAADNTVTTYAFVLNWPDDDTLKLGAPLATDETVVTLLGFVGNLPWTYGAQQKGLVITLPVLEPNQLPWSWVVKLEGLAA